MKKDGIQTRKRKPKSMGGGHGGVARPAGSSLSGTFYAWRDQHWLTNPHTICAGWVPFRGILGQTRNDGKNCDSNLRWIFNYLGHRRSFGLGLSDSWKTQPISVTHLVIICFDASTKCWSECVYVWWSAVEMHSHKVLPPLYAAVEGGAGGAGAPLLLQLPTRHQVDMWVPAKQKLRCYGTA